MGLDRSQSLDHYESILQDIRNENLWKQERVITTPQGNTITAEGKQVLNFCANNYLGLSSHPDLIKSAHDALDSHGFGLSSVRFICGTQDIHKQLEQRVSQWLGTDDTILYAAAFDANGGLFETILGPDDAVISDELNHASIIDGIRLSKAKRFRYKNADMADLEAKLKEADEAQARVKLIATDGVFSMDGIVAPLDDIVALARKYGALVMVDDCHASGFMGAGGRGTPTLKGVADDVDIVTSTLGKALGGASGGFTSGRRPIIDLLRQRSRPYLFSNTLAPTIVGASLKALDLVEGDESRRKHLDKVTRQFHEGMTAAGFTFPPSKELHPIRPVMIGDAQKATALADKLMDEGIYVIGFYYPVVPKGKARVRVQLSAAHSEDDVRTAVDAFTRAGRELGIIPA